MNSQKLFASHVNWVSESGRDTDRETEREGALCGWVSLCEPANMPYEVISAIRNRNVNRFILCAGHSSQATTLTTSTTTGNWQRSHENFDFDLKVSTRFLFNTQPWTSWQTCMTLHGDYCHVATSSLKSQVSRLKPRLTSVSPLEANDNRDQATAPIPFSPIHVPISLLPVAFPSVPYSSLLLAGTLLRLLSLHWVIKSCASVYWERDCVEEQLSLSSY